MLELPSVRNFTDTAEAVQPTAVSRSDEEVIEEELGKTAFLELMIAQIKNQDPLEPAKNEAFIAQLAQFSSVEGIQNLNESMDGLVDSLRAGLTMNAANLVGRDVLVPSSQIRLDPTGGLAGTIDVDTSVGALNLEIRDSTGSVVRNYELGAQQPGTHKFNWDGTDPDGNPMPPDVYRVSAYTSIDGVRNELQVNLPQRVVSVSFEQAGLIANLTGGESVPAVQIKEIQ